MNGVRERMAGPGKPAGEKVYRVVCVGATGSVAQDASSATQAPRTRVIRVCLDAGTETMPVVPR